MSGSGTWALVPLRQLAGGKERLAGVLPAAARCALVEAMAEDLVRALLELPLPSTQIVLVSEDPEVAGFALRLGVALFRPSPAVCDPLNAALAEAASRAAGSGAEAVLMIHADLPRASGPALRRLLAAHAASPSIAHATLVSDREGTGTNCLLLSLVELVRDAFQAHDLHGLAQQRIALAGRDVNVVHEGRRRFATGLGDFLGQPLDIFFPHLSADSLLFF